MRGAILIIGSLLWDPDKSRIGWRHKRLMSKAKIHVKAPIRYGRLSGRMENKNYTMVISKNCETDGSLGSAYVVPLKNKEIRSFKGVENQARFLSEAEGNKDKKLCKGEKKWCTIGILFNPNFNNSKKKEILNWWKELIKKDNGLNNVEDYKVGEEESILSEEGEILINWPKPIDINYQKVIDEIDFIIATCMKSELHEYPSIEELRDKALNDKRKYFFNNIKYGITTFEDRKIINL